MYNKQTQDNTEDTKTKQCEILARPQHARPTRGVAINHLDMYATIK